MQIESYNKTPDFGSTTKNFLVRTAIDAFFAHIPFVVNSAFNVAPAERLQQQQLLQC